MIFNRRTPDQNAHPRITVTGPNVPMAAKVQDSPSKINELLRHADALLKKGEAESALVLIREARSLEPEHPYGEAMEARTLRCIAEGRQPERAATAPPPKPAVTPKAAQPPATPPSAPPSLTSEPLKPVPLPLSPPAASPVSPTAPPKAAPAEAGRTRNRAVVLLIDDDDMLRTALQEAIERGGYDALGVGTSEEALVLLQRLTPDAIICDVNLETSSFGGFTLFERVQAIDHLRRVPFMFLTGLHDDVLLRTGKEMGADDYLRKPITEADLLSVLRGKIRRYRRLAGASSGATEHVAA